MFPQASFCVECLLGGTFWEVLETRSQAKVKELGDWGTILVGVLYIALPGLLCFLPGVRQIVSRSHAHSLLKCSASPQTPEHRVKGPQTEPIREHELRQIFSPLSCYTRRSMTAMRKGTSSRIALSISNICRAPATLARSQTHCFKSAYCIIYYNLILVIEVQGRWREHCRHK